MITDKKPTVFEVSLRTIMVTDENKAFGGYDDATLESMRTVVESLLAVLSQYDKPDYSSDLLPRPATVPWLEQVSATLTSILNVRYGCND